MKLQIFFSKSDGFAVSYELKCAVRAAILATLKYEGFPFDAEVSVTFADNEYIHGLNNEYRGMDKPTDVLSFPMYDDGFPYDECQHGCTLGDIVISLEKAEEQANELGHDLIREVAFLAIHSTLHLLGYDHERSPEEDEEQCRRQREILESLIAE
ncbi:MAG: rRNA maturation RNase YbeY [Clostridia bacterium]|nr:rRNA maturation RNase YbeY [Clostridia bacterium]